MTLSDVDPPFENSEEFFNTEEDYQDALIGAYDLLQTTYINVMLGRDCIRQYLVWWRKCHRCAGIQEIDEMIHTPINQQLRDIWGWMYAGVNRANYHFGISG